MKALSPLFLFLALYLGISLAAGDFYKVPVTVAFLMAAAYAIAIYRGRSISERIQTFSRGASQSNVMLMVWIYLLAGAFAASAKAMGSVDATVGLTLHLLPASLLLPGIFLAACFISLAIGTSVGTIAALTPVAVGIAQQSEGVSLPLMVAIVVGGAYFGDNLSFISDTTISATQTQGCRMRDKFHTNLMIVLPVALVILALYWWIGLDVSVPQDLPEVSWHKVIPYLLVIVTAICGLDVMLVLALGLLLTAIIGVADGSYDLLSWMSALGEGMASMGDLIIMAMLAAGTLEIISEMGGIRYLIAALTRGIKGRRGAEFSIASLVSLVNVCTANNTVSIITTGPIAHNIAEKYGIDPRRSASILDTASCFTQGLLPYSAQLLVATGLASASIGLPVNPAAILPYLFYPMALGIAVVLSILFRYPGRYAKRQCPAS